ncbi:discoidin domain-containing protein [Lysinibacillus capsici]|uniref:discoidin domain-containing protein n=1 Tax=Lysinibacillus capsici TaxID=2115968 RepID=UPI002FDDAE47
MAKASDISAIPIMTSNTTPSGIVSASSEFSTSYQAWIVFGQTAKNAYWCSKYREGSSWLSYEFPQAKRIIRYSILMESGVAYAPFNWTFEGFDEASGTWIVLDTRTEVSFVINIKQLYDFNNDGFFKKYRINISKGSNTDYTYISKMEMFEPLPEKRAVLQNPTTNQHYSLSDNTLIHLPDNTTESIIEYGVEQGRHIQLDVPFTKHRYFNDTPVANVNGGKVFTHDVGVINTLSIKELVKNNNFESIFNWYETNMTANNAPSPLVASASDQQTGFETYKAFNNLNTASDTWMTNSNIVNGWIQLDLGSSMIFNCVRITSRNGVGYDTHSPKDFEILASNDNNTFTKLGTFNSNTAWKNYEQRAFTFSNTTAYRYYRVDVLSNNGGVIVAINNISFGYKREVS